MTPRPQPFIIFGVERKELSASENSLRTESALKELTKLDIPFKLVQGCYKGAKEVSILVHGDNLERAYLIACNADQESILSVNEERTAKILVCGDATQDCIIGKWSEVPQYVAELADCYTYDQEADKFYVCD